MKTMKQNETQNLILMDSISYHYPGTDQYVFRDFSAVFPTADRTAILARSGSGKTTLLHLLAGLLTPTGGVIHYPSGTQKPPAFSMVFQENRLLEYRSVLKNVKLTAGNTTDAVIANTLDRAGLTPYRNKKISALSGGEKRRCAIVRALLADYDMLLLDEPFTGLDSSTKTVMMELVKESAGQKGILLVTHDESEAAFFSCDILRL